MPAYSGPTAAVMAACLSQNSTLSTRLPGKHHTEPATALQGGRTHLTPPPEPQRRPRGICNCLPASAVSVTASPILESLHACLPSPPLLQSDRCVFQITSMAGLPGGRTTSARKPGTNPPHSGPAYDDLYIAENVAVPGTVVKLVWPVRQPPRRAWKWKRSCILSQKAAGMVGGLERPSVAWILNGRVGVLKAE